VSPTIGERNNWMAVGGKRIHMGDMLPTIGERNTCMRLQRERHAWLLEERE
jgi:hypothetical protein